ncbi:sterol desaturase family protein [Falsirhodobacter halotolerans]|uniref:sterol desaturase family protein n=1 Tax=Falsirhodobacter halotolerans TaxID=1146892 RepID=UPI001FD27E37|nr:sterol desaturase family protein [Falsirhodobacter halotolerans]MCJ8138926.1 sterol desaturase family protein [Falsirhodobacter halotolerans]
MSWILPIVVVIATVAFMEWVAWASHKYIMHGWGWGWHKSHHEETHGMFELNDLYAVVFALFSIGLFVAGEWLWRPATWLGIGVLIYGILYFIAHDGLVHKRWPFHYIPRKGYAKRLYQAHRLHHAVEGKEGCVSFGFIWARPVKTLVKELDQNKRADRNLMRDVQEGRE